MLYSVHAPNAPASVSFGERRLGHTPLPKSFSLCIGLVARQSQTTQPAPYPSPPMTGLSPPDTFSLQRQKTERQPLDQEIQTQNIPRDKRQHQLFQSPDDPPEALSTVSATGDSGIPQPGQMTVTSPIGRSPFLAQTSMPAQQQRKTKSHVASACVNCKKAHLACDVRRPCPRCVSLNKQDTCIDVQHKKRGRPRLRDERTHSFEVNQIGSLSSSISHLHHHQGSIEHHNHGDRSSPLSSPTTNLSPPSACTYRSTNHSHRVIKSQAGDSHSRIARSLSSYALRSPQSSQELTRYFDDRPSVVVQGSSSSSYNVKRTPQFDLQAFTTVDLVIAWSTEKLRGFLGCQERELNCMKSLFDIVSLDDHKKLYRLAGQIQEEVQRRDSTYLSPPAQTVFAIIRNTGLSDMEPAFYASLMEETLDLRVASGRKYRTILRTRVVKTSVFFVIADFVSVEEVHPISQSKTIHPPQYTPPIQGYGAEHILPLVSPLQQAHPWDPPAPQPSFSWSQPRALLSPPGSRPRSLHMESTYPSLAHYANSSSQYSNQFSSNWARGAPLPIAYSGPNFRRHSEQSLLASNSLTLPPLRALHSLERPSSAGTHIKTEPLGSDPVSMPKRIAVKDVLQ